MAADDHSAKGLHENGPLGSTIHLASQSALLLSSGIVSYACTLLLNLVLARFLGARHFGAWAVAFAVAQMLSILGLLGADWVIVRYGSYFHGLGDMARLRRTIHFGLRLSGVTLLALGAATALSADVVASRVFHASDVSSLLRIAGVTGIVMGLRQVLVYGTQAFKDMRAAALIRNLLQPAFRLVAVSVALMVVTSTVSAMVGLLVAEVFLTIVAALVLHRSLDLLGPTESIERHEIVRFALPVWGTRLTETLRAQIFPVLLGSLANLAGSGVFVASNRIVMAEGAVTAAMNQVFNPMGSDLHLRGRRDEFVTLLKNTGKWTFTLGLPWVCLQIGFPVEILSLFGERFTDAESALVVMAVGMLFFCSTGPVTMTLIIAGRSRLALIDYLIVVAVEVVLGVLLIPSHGVLGAAIATTVGTALNNVLPFAQVWSILGFHPLRSDYLKPAAAGFGAILFAKAIAQVFDVGHGPVAAIVVTIAVLAGYVGLLLLVGLTEEDRAALARFRRLIARRARPTR